MARLKDLYNKEIVKKLKEGKNYDNLMQVPRIEKIVVNMSSSDAVANSKVVDAMKEDLMTITGQAPYITRAKKSIAGFKLREGQKLGVAVTLRREKMYEFLDRLLTITLPRVKDFKGLSDKAFDGRGNYTLGIREHIVFPEINYDKVDKIRGMNITIVTSAKNNDDARELLSLFGFPFRKQQTVN